MKRIITHSVKHYIYLLILIAILIVFFSINNLTFSSDIEKQTIAEVLGVNDYTLIVPQSLKMNYKEGTETFGELTFKIHVDDYEESGLDYIDKEKFGKDDTTIKQKKRNVYECKYRIYEEDKNFKTLEYIKSKNNETIKTVLYLAAIVVVAIIAVTIKKNRTID